MDAANVEVFTGAADATVKVRVCVCARVCVCVRARARACVCVCVLACMISLFYNIGCILCRLLHSQATLCTCAKIRICDTLPHGTL